MTLNVNEPTDQRMVSELPKYIRENRVDINAFIDVSGEVSSQGLNVATGTSTLVIPTNLTVAQIETIYITSSGGVSNISLITGGSARQIKIFVFGDNNVSMIDGLKATPGAIYLNQLPVLSTFNAQIDDVIALMNVDGAGAIFGYWKELWRQVSVK